jgi:hypothetical protein
MTITDFQTIKRLDAQNAMLGRNTESDAYEMTNEL